MSLSLSFLTANAASAATTAGGQSVAPPIAMAGASWEAAAVILALGTIALGWAFIAGTRPGGRGKARGFDPTKW